MVYYTAQLFSKPSEQPGAWQNVTRKVNMNWNQDHVHELWLKELTNDIRDNWDTTYSVNLFPPSKVFDGEKIDATKNRHIPQISLIVYLWETGGRMIINNQGQIIYNLGQIISNLCRIIYNLRKFQIPDYK
jgi:hypothetical protein